MLGCLLLRQGRSDASGADLRSRGRLLRDGGHVYRGEALPELEGHYFYGDFCAGWVRSFRLEGSEAVDRRQWDLEPTGSITSFGVDARGELYLLVAEGSVFRIVRGGS